MEYHQNASFRQLPCRMLPELLFCEKDKIIEQNHDTNTLRWHLCGGQGVFLLLHPYRLTYLPLTPLGILIATHCMMAQNYVSACMHVLGVCVYVSGRERERELKSMKDLTTISILSTVSLQKYEKR